VEKAKGDNKAPYTEIGTGQTLFHERAQVAVDQKSYIFTELKNVFECTK